MATKQEVLARLTPAQRALVTANPDLLRREIEARASFPLKSLVPNRAQERALAPYRQKHPTYGNFPHLMVFTGGNGVGKTNALVQLVGGITLGPEFMHPDYYANHELFLQFKKMRRRKAARIRIVCNAADMSEKGSVYQEIKQWIPVAQFSDKLGGYYTTITIPAPTPEYIPTVIDVKTHNQETVAHAGPTMDMVIFNEPPPEAIWGENVSRTRGTGFIAAFLTPLDMDPYLYNIVTAPHKEGEVVHVEASIWENCRDIAGNRGHLTAEAIETQISDWTKENPLTLPARRDGKFVFLAGAIFQLYSAGVHRLAPQPIRREWNIYMGCDPHPHKPHVALWIALDPLGHYRVIAEYPTEPWDQMLGTSLTLRHFGEEFSRIEQGRNPKFPYMLPDMQMRNRAGDPLGMKAEHPLNRKTMAQEYAEHCGLEFDLSADNDLAMGHDRIRELLFYDVARPVNSVNTPHLWVYSTCYNMNRALTEYRLAAAQGRMQSLSARIDDTWKCWIDVLRYILAIVEPWSPSSQDVNPDFREFIAPHPEAVLAHY